MPDDTGTPQDGTTEAPAEESPQDTFDREYVEKLRAEAAKYRTEARANAEAASKLMQLEEAQKSEQERLADRLERAESQAQQAASALMRYQVAISKGLPAELVGRLHGETEEELAADADALLNLIATPDSGSGPRPDLSQGAKAPQNHALNGDPLLRDLKDKLGIR